jgi:hypothetical protein
VIALGGFALGLVAWGLGYRETAWWSWAVVTAIVVAYLVIAMIRNLLAACIGVDAVAFISMSGALVLVEALAGIVVAVIFRAPAVPWQTGQRYLR